MAAHRISDPDGVPPVRKRRFDLLRIANREAKEAEKKQQRILRKKEKEEKARSEDAKRRI